MSRLVLVGTYPPTECGLATFTANLRGALQSAEPQSIVDVVRLVREVDDTSEDAPEVAVT